LSHRAIDRSAAFASSVVASIPIRFPFTKPASPAGPFRFQLFLDFWRQFSGGNAENDGVFQVVIQFP
jgi:hypothetical protein